MSKHIKLNFNQLAAKSLKFIGKTVKKQAKDNMKEVSHGRTYIIGGKKHIASKRGDAPNNLSGDLSESIGFEQKDTTMIFGLGNASVDYAKYLEGVLWRPNAIKSVLQNKDKIEQELTKMLKQSLKVK